MAFCRKLLVADRTKRIGNLRNGAEDVKTHKWFKGMDWEDVFNRMLRPPLVPRVRYDGNTANFDDYSKEEIQKAEKVTAREAKLLKTFDQDQEVDFYNGE